MARYSARRVRYNLSYLVAAGLAVIVFSVAVGAAGATPNSKSSPKKAHASSASIIKVAAIQDFAGAGAAGADATSKGLNLGFHDFGSHVNGHPIQLKYFDAASDPSIALSQARAAVDSYHANVIIGPSLASDLGAISPYIATTGTPMDDHGICSLPQLAIHQSTSALIYSSAWTCNAPSLVAADWAYNTMHWRHMTMVGQDYAFGWVTVGAFAYEFKKLGGTIDKYIWVPLTAGDFSPYISSIPRSTQAAYVEISGVGSARFMSAYAGFGLKGQIPVLGAVTLTDQSVLPSMSAADVSGTYMAANYCDGINSKLNNYFVKEYYAKYKTYPGYYAEAGYTKARVLLNAFKKLNGNVSDKAKLGKALMAININGARGPVKLDTSLRAPIENVYVCQVKTVNGALRNVPVATYKNVPPWGPLTKASWLEVFNDTAGGRPG